MDTVERRAERMQQESPDHIAVAYRDHHPVRVGAADPLELRGSAGDHLAHAFTARNPGRAPARVVGLPDGVVAQRVQAPTGPVAVIQLVQAGGHADRQLEVPAERRRGLPGTLQGSAVHRLDRQRGQSHSQGVGLAAALLVEVHPRSPPGESPPHMVAGGVADQQERRGHG